MKCKDCGEKMTLVDMPQEIFTIPFTKGRFCIWDWNKKDYICYYCIQENEERQKSDIYDSIAQSVGTEAYEEGFRDGSKQNY